MCLKSQFWKPWTLNTCHVDFLLAYSLILRTRSVWKWHPYTHNYSKYIQVWSSSSALQDHYHLLRVLQKWATTHAPMPVDQTRVLRVRNPLRSSHRRWTMRQKISSRNDLPLNTHKHIKHGCLRCSSMTPFIAGPHNERPAVQGDNATSGAIITQVCGWDEGSKKACASALPPAPLPKKKKKKTGEKTRGLYHRG